MLPFNFVLSLLIFVPFFGILLFILYIFPLFLGAPFVVTPKEKVGKMLRLAQPKEGEILYDLGSGDGRIVIEAARKYKARAIGIEINPILVFLSRRKIRKLGLGNRVKIYWGNFFRKNLSDADIIITYLLQPTNNYLEKKFQKELKPGTRIVSLSFTFKNIPLVKSHPKEPAIRLYQI